ncbi:MAG: hypothetical protein ACYS1A_03705 [Planctomycetota bacterium]|jgi:hypothetical protein
MTAKKIFCTVLIVASSSRLFAAADSNAWEQLNLGSAHISGAMVYYEKPFEPNLPFFEKAYKESLTEKDKSNEILAKKDQIFADINHILGITEPDKKMQNDIMMALGGVFSETKLTFYLVKQTTIKDFLRRGGKLPNFTYDKTTDMVKYQMEFEMTGESGPLKNKEITFPLGSEETFEEEVEQIFKILQEEIFGVGKFGTAIHEVIEMSLLKRVKPSGPYWRWFSDGFAEAIAYEILNKHVSKKSAEAHVARHEVDKYKDLEEEINLQYWMSLRYCVLHRTPIKYEERLTYARYAYAKLEAQRLIEKYGIDCVRKILDEVCAKKSRTSDELMKAIKKVTGEDMRQRLEQYQTFETPKEGMDRHTNLLNAAAKKEGYEQMFINLLRMIELQQHHYSHSNMFWRRSAGWLLFKMGYEEAGDEIMYNCIEFFKNSRIPGVHETAMEKFIQYALWCDNPQKALKVAEELLKTKPDNVFALIAQMLADVKSDKLPRARQTAKRILTLVDKKSEPYKIASGVLAADPN